MLPSPSGRTMRSRQRDGVVAGAIFEPCGP
jgi:hypothetical protein